MAKPKKPKAPKKTSVGRPMNAQKFMASINSPWRNLGDELNKLTQVHYPEPTISLPAVNYDLLNNRLKKPQDRTKHRSSNDMWRQMYDYDAREVELNPGALGFVVGGLLTRGTVSDKQLGRLTPEVAEKLNQIFRTQESSEAYGGEATHQQDGLVNKIFDVLMTFGNAGATNQAENAQGKADWFSALSVVSSLAGGFIGEKIAGNRTDAQQLWDEATSTQAEMKAAMAKADPGSTEYESLKMSYDAMVADRAKRLGSYHPMVQPDIENFGARPSGEYLKETEKKKSPAVEHLVKWIVDYKQEGVKSLNIVPDIIPTSGKEAKSWWKGFTHKAHNTYGGNLDKEGLGNGWVTFLGEVVFDPITYVTGGTGAVAKGAAKAGIGLGRLEKGIFAAKDIEGVKSLLAKAEPVLKGKTINILGKPFVIGKNTAEDLEAIITGGAKSGRGSTAGAVGKRQRDVIRDFNSQMDDIIKKEYADLHAEMMDVKKAMKKASSPEVITAKIKNLAQRAASMNLEKDVADALEDLIKRGDLLDVPQPKPKTTVKSLDELGEKEFDEVLTIRTTRSNYLSGQAKKFVAATAKPLKKTAKVAGKGTRRLVSTAPTVVKFTSMSKVPASRIIEEVLGLARENIPGMAKALDNYEDYIRTYGGNPSDVLLVEDVAATPSLIKQGLVAPEVRRVLPMFDVSDVKSIADDPLGRMFKSMGYTDEETLYMLQRYRAAMAQRLNLTFAQGSNTLRLSDHALDWSDVAKARKTNAKAMSDVIEMVGKQGKVLSRDLQEYIAKASADMGKKTGTKSAVEIRVAGVPVVHFTSPEVINKGFNKFMQGDSLIATSLKNYSTRVKDGFRGYSAFDAELNHIRTKNIGQGEQLISAHLNYLHRLWQGVGRKDQNKILDHWAAGATPETLEKYGPQLANLDETFAALESYLPAMFGKSIEEITVDEFTRHFNRWLPDKLKFKEGTMAEVKAMDNVEWMTPDFWKEYFRKVTFESKPKGRKPVGNVSGLEVIWQTRMAMEKEIARSTLGKNIEDTWGLNIEGMAKDSPTLKTLTDVPHNERWVRISDHGFDQNVLFPPDIAHEIKKMMQMLDNRHSSEIAYGKLSRVTTFWKAMVTVYNVPDYFVRNSLSDAWMMFYSGFSPKYLMSGPKILADTGRYLKLLRENPEFARAFVQADPLNREAMEKGMSLADHAMKMDESATAISFNRGFKTANGETIKGLNSVQALKYYFEYGLETNFVRTSLAAVHQTSARASRYIGDPIKVANSYGEDARRLSLMMDGLSKAEIRGITDFDEALNYAAEHVRKYLFDYSDFSNMERNVLGRAIPFYKWSRKAVPLMTEMLFFKPGKVAMIPKINTALNSAFGGENSDDNQFSWIPTNDAIIPSWMRTSGNYFFTGDTDVPGTTQAKYGSYAAFPDPFTEVMNRIVDPLVSVPGSGLETIDSTATPNERTQKYVSGIYDMIMSQANPVVKAPIEAGTNRQSFGANEQGGRPLENLPEYLMSMWPQIRKAQEVTNIAQGDTPASLAELLNAVGAINLQHNTPERQMSELMFLKPIMDQMAKRYEERRPQNRGR